jgi:restriction endonuclease S subunit
VSSPFDEVRYKELLKGLEVSEVMLSELQDENKSFRIDSEYLRKEYLLNIAELQNYSNGFIRLSEATKHMSGGATPLGAEYPKEGIPFLRVQNIMQNYFNLDDVVYLTKQQDEEIKRSRLKENDVLLTITGVSYGKSAVVPDSLVNANINQHSVKITLKPNLNPYFLSTFLNAKQGKLQSDKNIVGVTRPALDYEVIRNFVIPNVSKEFQHEIENIIRKSIEINEQSQLLYRQAEDLLLETIGLKDFQPSQTGTNIKSFKESFLATGRLDAEYYQSKYDVLEGKLESMPHACVSDLVSFINHGKQPPYIENGTVRVFSQKWIGDKSIDYSFLNANDEPFTSEEFAEQHNKYVARKNDILYYSVGANLGYCHNYLIDEPIMPGSFITLIRANDKANPLYLGFVLNSKIGRMQAEKHKSASAQPYIYPKDISGFLIPLIDKEIQDQIAELIRESFALRRESERLLEEAKEMVEKEIEY